MNPRQIDLKEMKMTENRLRAFKERNFESCGYDNPVPTFIKVVLVSICIAVAILFILSLFLI